MKQQKEETTKYDKIGENSSIDTDDNVVFGSAMKAIFANRPEVLKYIDEWKEELNNKKKIIKHLRL